MNPLPISLSGFHRLILLLLPAVSRLFENSAPGTADEGEDLFRTEILLHK